MVELGAEVAKPMMTPWSSCGASSLAVAPAVLLAQGADWADLDAPLYLAEDRAPGLAYEGARGQPPSAALWG